MNLIRLSSTRPSAVRTVSDTDLSNETEHAAELDVYCFNNSNFYHFPSFRIFATKAHHVLENHFETNFLGQRERSMAVNFRGRVALL